MAQIVGGIATSHVPAIGARSPRGMQDDPYWKPFFDGFPPVRDWLDEVQARRRRACSTTTTA